MFSLSIIIQLKKRINTLQMHLFFCHENYKLNTFCTVKYERAVHQFKAQLWHQVKKKKNLREHKIHKLKANELRY